MGLVQLREKYVFPDNLGKNCLEKLRKLKKMKRLKTF